MTDMDKLMYTEELSSKVEDEDLSEEKADRTVEALKQLNESLRLLKQEVILKF